MRTRQASFLSLAMQQESLPAPWRSRLVQCDSLIGFLYEGGSSLLWGLIADCGRICLQIVRLPAVLPYSTFRNPADGRFPRMAKTSGFSLFLWQLSCVDSSLTVAEFVSKLSGVTGFLAVRMASGTPFPATKSVSSLSPCVVRRRVSGRFSLLVSGFRAFFLVGLVPPCPTGTRVTVWAVINVAIQNAIYQWRTLRSV